MFRRITLACLALLASASAFAGSTVSLSGVEFSVDTLFHAKIGPGTTQTSLHLINQTNTSQQLRVFYLTTDLTTASVGVESIVAQDKLSGGGTCTSMAESHSTADKTYFAGINTDFFITSGTATNGVSMVGAPVRAAIAGGEIYRTSDSSAAWPQIFINEDGTPQIGAVSFADGTATFGDRTVKFSRVNEDAANNVISVYTPKFYGIMNQPGLQNTCAEVTAKMVEGDMISVGKKVKLEITSELTSTGNRVIPDGEYLLVGRGSTYSFIEALKVGDIVTLEASAKVKGADVTPKALATGNPWILRDGETLATEGDRGDAVARHPRSGIGYTSDKKTLIMMVIDGRSSISAGVHTEELADMLHYAGATDALNVDGGGSSTLYTLPLGVRNKTSDGKERAVASGMFITADVPADDKNITEIRFEKWAMVSPQYGLFKPVVYGYNKYGMLVDTDVKEVKLTCDDKIGEIINDGTTFYGTKEGTGVLTATYNGMTASIPVTVNPLTGDGIRLRLGKVLIDDKRSYPVEVESLVGEKYMEVNPGALSWDSDNKDVATIDASKGVLKGVSNGTANVSGSVGDFTGKLNVTVEIPEGKTMPVLRSFPTDGWNLRQTGGSNLSISELENGFKLAYEGNGVSRGAYISVDKDMVVYSLPSSIQFRINPGAASIKKITMNATNALGEKTTSWIVAPSELEANKEVTLNANLSDWTDIGDVGIYPITINSIRFDMAKSAKGQNFEISVPDFVAVYDGEGGVGETITPSTFKLYPNPVRSGEPVSLYAEDESEISVYSLNGMKIYGSLGSGMLNIPTEGMEGVYIVRIKSGTTVKTAKLLIQ